MSGYYHIDGKLHREMARTSPKGREGGSSMSERRGRGLPAPSTNGHEPTPIAGLDGPKRWRVAISATVFEGYAFLTDKEAFALQDMLKARRDVFGNVFLRAEQGQQPNDYTTVESVIADIELAVPVKK